MFRIANPMVRPTALTGLLAASALTTLLGTVALAQQVTGVPSSPSATTTLDVKQLPPPSNRDVLSEQEIQSKSAEWHAQCMRDWDQQTHMTKREWFRACQRTVDDRVQWLRGKAKQ